MNKKTQIKIITLELLGKAYKDMQKHVNKVLSSGCIDIDGWDPNVGQYTIPKRILLAILEDQARAWFPYRTGTSFERETKKEVKNIRRFI